MFTRGLYGSRKFNLCPKRSPCKMQNINTCPHYLLHTTIQSFWYQEEDCSKYNYRHITQLDVRFIEICSRITTQYLIEVFSRCSILKQERTTDSQIQVQIISLRITMNCTSIWRSVLRKSFTFVFNGLVNFISWSYCYY